MIQICKIAVMLIMLNAFTSGPHIGNMGNCFSTSPESENQVNLSALNTYIERSLRSHVDSSRILEIKRDIQEIKSNLNILRIKIDNIECITNRYIPAARKNNQDILKDKKEVTFGSDYMEMKGKKTSLKITYIL